MKYLLFVFAIAAALPAQAQVTMRPWPMACFSEEVFDSPEAIAKRDKPQIWAGNIKPFGVAHLMQSDDGKWILVMRFSKFGTVCILSVGTVGEVGDAMPPPPTEPAPEPPVRVEPKPKEIAI